MDVSYRKQPFFSHLVTLFGQQHSDYYQTANDKTNNEEGLYFLNESILNKLSELIFYLGQKEMISYYGFFQQELQPYFNSDDPNIGYSWATPTYSELKKLESAQKVVARHFRAKKKSKDPVST